MSGGITSVTLPEISVGLEPGLGGGALPGNGSYGDPISGFHQINQQFADGQRAFSEATANRSNEINAQFQAQNEARAVQMQAQFESNMASMNAQRAALFAAPPVTGPILPPNFSQTAQAPAALPAAPEPAPPPPPAFGLDGPADPAATGIALDQPRFGLGGPLGPDGTDVATPSDRPPPPTGDGLSYRGAVLPLGVTTQGDLVPAVPGFLKSIGDGLGFFNRTLNGEASIYDPATGQISDEAIASGLALGGLGMTGGFGGVAARAGETVLGAGPVGRLGNPIKVIGAQNERTVINGREFSGHALDQMSGRGLLPSVVENTIQQGTVYPTRTGTIGYFDSVNRVRVVTDAATGRVVTVIPGAP